MIHWHSLTLGDVFEVLGSRPEGLSQVEREKQLKRLGLNKLPDAKIISEFSLFLEQFKNHLVYILGAIALVSFFVGHLVDGFFIVFVLLVNALVSFFIERKTNQALQKLKHYLSFWAKLISSGEIMEVKREHLVPGDIIILGPGDKVPADARLLEAEGLKISEAALTGEFWGVQKKVMVLPEKTLLAERNNMIFSGTTVEEGRAKAIVVLTGTQTELGRIFRLTKEAETNKKTPLQKKIAHFSKIFASFILAVALVIFLVGLLRGLAPLDSFTIAAVLAVSAIPEGLLPVMTAVLALGMKRILKKKGLVRKLSSAETLGGATIICLDKTGTLTSAKMMIAEVIAESQLEALDIAIHCNEAFFDEKGKVFGSPTDKALLESAIKGGIKRHRPRLDWLPFSQEQKYLATLHPRRLFMAGAPEVILALSKRPEERYNKDLIRLTKQGLRVIGVAQKKLALGQAEHFVLSPENTRELEFIGLIALKDPLRSGIKAAIKTAQAAGIRPVIVSGDHPLTVKNIARELELEVGLGQIITGGELQGLTDEELRNRLNDINVFSRVAPEDKLRIVRLFQENGEVVTMIGDGVNDGPALTTADVGVALASGADVARESADLVLLNNNFSTVISAIAEGRIIFRNLKKVILYLFSAGFSGLILVLLSLVFALPLPLLPAQILWINIIGGTLPAFSLGLEPAEPGFMTGKKFRRQQLLEPNLIKLFLIIAIFTGLTSFLLFVVLRFFAFSMEEVRTMVMAAESLGSLLFIFSCRSLSQNIWRQNPFSNKWIWWGIGLSFTALLLAIYTPLLQTILQTTAMSFSQWGLVGLAALFDIGLIEIFKRQTVVKKGR